MIKSKYLFGNLLIAALALTLGSCLKSNDGCDFSPCGIVATQAEVQEIHAHLASNNITNATQHCSGMFYVIENAGTGGTPTACSDVRVSYIGKLGDGSVFEPQSTPVNFSLNNLIDGWRIGLPLIKSGGRIILFIPPSLGFGNVDRVDENGNVVIPANSMVIFEINLF